MHVSAHVSVHGLVYACWSCSAHHCAHKIGFARWCACALSAVHTLVRTRRRLGVRTSCALGKRAFENGGARWRAARIVPSMEFTL